MFSVWSGNFSSPAELAISFSSFLSSIFKLFEYSLESCFAATEIHMNFTSKINSHIYRTVFYNSIINSIL